MAEKLEPGMSWNAPSSLVPGTGCPHEALHVLLAAGGQSDGILGNGAFVTRTRLRLS